MSSEQSRLARAEESNSVRAAIPYRDRVCSPGRLSTSQKGFYCRNFTLGTLYAQQREVRRNVVSRSMNADFEQGCRRTFAQIDNRLPCPVPASCRPQPTCAGKVGAAGLIRQKSRNQHAFVYLNQQLLHHPAAGICPQQRKWSTPIKPCIRAAQPRHRPLTASIYHLSGCIARITRSTRSDSSTVKRSRRRPAML